MDTILSIQKPHALRYLILKQLLLLSVEICNVHREPHQIIGLVHATLLVGALILEV